MKFFRNYLSNCKYESVPAEGPADGSTVLSDENNGENNTNPFADMWDNTPSESSETPAVNGAPQAVAPAQTPDAVFNDHFNSLQIGAGFDMQGLADDIREGGVEQLNNFANVLAKDVYKAAMVQSNKLMANKVQEAVDLAVNKSSGEFNASMATRELNGALPFTSEPEIKPIADAIFARFVKNGSTVKESINKTKEYFEHTFKVARKQLEIQPPNAKPGSGGFGGSSNNFVDEDEDNLPDWLDILGGGSS